MWAYPFGRRDTSAEIAVTRRNIACRHYRAPVKELGQPSTYVVHRKSIGGLILNFCEVIRNYSETSHKGSGRFDLPIAIGILAAAGQIQCPQLTDYEFAGELALSGQLRAIRGALAMSCQASRAGKFFILPRASAAEAALVRSGQVYAADSLLQVCAHLNGVQPCDMAVVNLADNSAVYPDLADVKGQMAARHALEVAAAGGHSLLFIGPPGTGKSMLASRLPGILPEMSEDEALAAATIQSLGTQGFRPEQWRQRPFRSPHHTASAVALVGGGSDPRPGEVSLAHHGVLFLDELPEFERKVLEVLREPLESRVINISRASRQACFPADFQLVAAMNPCPCGYLGHASGRCQCTPEQIARYAGKLSGPLLDRIDMHVQVPALAAGDLATALPGEGSQQIRLRVQQARDRQLQRQGCCNARLSGAELEQHAAADQTSLVLLGEALDRLGLSARSYHRILRIARTIADMDGEHRLGRQHMLQAIQLRRSGLAL